MTKAQGLARVLVTRVYRVSMARACDMWRRRHRQCTPCTKQVRERYVREKVDGWIGHLVLVVLDGSWMVLGWCLMVLDDVMGPVSRNM